MCIYMSIFLTHGIFANKMAVGSGIFYATILPCVLIFVSLNWSYGLSRQEYAWVENYYGLSQKWNPDTTNCIGSISITAKCAARYRLIMTFIFFSYNI